MKNIIITFFLILSIPFATYTAHTDYIPDIEPIDDNFEWDKVESHHVLAHNPDIHQMLDHSKTTPQPSVPKNIEDITAENIQYADLADFDLEIADINPEIFQHITIEQTRSLSGLTLHYIFMQPKLTQELNVQELNPASLKATCDVNSAGGKNIPDSFVHQLTQKQAQAILQGKHYESYFNDAQIKLIKEKAIPAASPDQPTWHSTARFTPEHHPEDDLQSQKESVEFVDFDPVEKPSPTPSPTPTNSALSDPELMTPADIAQLSPRDIQNLGYKILQLPLETFKDLSPDQTAALNAKQIRLIMDKPELLNSLNVKFVQPDALAEIFTYEDAKNLLPAELIRRLTPEQAAMILKKFKADLTPDQTELLSQKTSEPQAENPKSTPNEPTATTQKPTKTSFWDIINKGIKKLNDFFNRNRTLSEASRMAREKARGKHDASKETTSFDSYMKKLTMKEKELVCNRFVDELSGQYRKEQTQIKRHIQEVNNSTLLTQEEKTEKTARLHRDLNKLQQRFNEKIESFKFEVTPVLKPNEVIVSIAADNDPSFKAYEILDMSKIDPTKSIDDQLESIDRSVHTSYEGFKGKITAKSIRDSYTSWVANQIDDFIEKNPSGSVLDQITKITGHDWSTLNTSILEEIITKLDEPITPH